MIEDHKSPLVLFPSSDAVTGAQVQDKGPHLIIVLDGSWKEAKRMN